MKLGEVIKAYRSANKLGVRALAQIIGISHGTLSRLERGYDVDGRTLTKVLTWLFGE